MKVAYLSGPNSCSKLFLQLISMAIHHDNEDDLVTICMPLQLLRSIEPKDASFLKNVFLSKKIVPRLIDYQYLDEPEWLDVKRNLTSGNYSCKRYSTFKVSDWGVDLFDIDKVILLTSDKSVVLYHKHVQYIYVDACCDKSKEVKTRSSTEEVFRNVYSAVTPRDIASSILLDFESEAERIFS